MVGDRFREDVAAWSKAREGMARALSLREPDRYVSNWLKGCLEQSEDLFRLSPGLRDCYGPMNLLLKQRAAPRKSLPPLPEVKANEQEWQALERYYKENQAVLNLPEGLRGPSFLSAVDSGDLVRVRKELLKINADRTKAKLPPLTYSVGFSTNPPLRGLATKEGAWRIFLNESAHASNGETEKFVSVVLPLDKNGKPLKEGTFLRSGMSVVACPKSGPCSFWDHLVGSDKWGAHGDGTLKLRVHDAHSMLKAFDCLNCYDSASPNPIQTSQDASPDDAKSLAEMNKKIAAIAEKVKKREVTEAEVRFPQTTDLPDTFLKRCSDFKPQNEKASLSRLRDAMKCGECHDGSSLKSPKLSISATASYDKIKHGEMPSSSPSAFATLGTAGLGSDPASTKPLLSDKRVAFRMAGVHSTLKPPDSPVQIGPVVAASDISGSTKSSHIFCIALSFLTASNTLVPAPDTRPSASCGCICRPRRRFGWPAAYPEGRRQIENLASARR